MKKLLLIILLATSFTGQSQTGTKVAFLSDASSVNTIAEEDTKAAATLTQSTYGTDFKFLQMSTMVASDLNDVATIFFYYDKTGNFELPSGGNVPANVITMLTQFVEAGGSILLGGFATRYIDDIGRIPYQPTIAGNGNGVSNNDNWGINYLQNIPTDVSAHPSFSGITTTNVRNASTMTTYGYQFAPFISLGQKENHNSMWDLNQIADLTETHPSVARGAEFETLTTSTILGTWQHVTDMCCIAAAEFHPTGSWAGTIIAVGPAAYEHSMVDNSGNTNPWQGNVDLFTTNTLTYLRSLTQSLSTKAANIKAITLVENPVKNELSITKKTGDELYITLHNISGKHILDNIKITDSAIDVSSLQSGLYIAQIKDNTNSIVKTLKVIKE